MAVAESVVQLITRAIEHGAEAILIEEDGIRFRVQGQYGGRTGFKNGDEFKNLVKDFATSGRPLRSQEEIFVVVHTAALGTVGAWGYIIESDGKVRLTVQLRKNANAPLSVDEIGLSPTGKRLLKKWSSASSGVVAFSGPQGSGKTTTRYAALLMAAQRPDLVGYSIDHPVACQIAGLRPIDVPLTDLHAVGHAVERVMGSKSNLLSLHLEYASREQACRLAIEAAKSGVLVFVELEAASTTDTLRLLETASGIDPHDLMVGVCWQGRDGPGGSKPKYRILDFN